MNEVFVIMCPFGHVLVPTAARCMARAPPAMGENVLPSRAAGTLLQEGTGQAIGSSGKWKEERLLYKCNDESFMTCASRVLRAGQGAFGSGQLLFISLQLVPNHPKYTGFQGKGFSSG